MDHLHTLMVEIQNGTATLENSLAVSLKTKNELTRCPSNCTLGHLSQRNQNLC